MMMKKITNFKGFDIYFEPLKELTSMRKHFLEECDWSKKDYEALTATKPKWFIARVVAKKGGIELGEEFLGGCCYRSHKEFYTTYFGDYFKGMMEEAVKNAEAQVKRINFDGEATNNE
jgi:hypothetical protein